MHGSLAPTLAIQAEDVATQTLRAAQAGSLDAFADIVQAHQRLAFSTALRMLGDAGLAEDVAQDVFVELSRHLREIQSVEHLTSWVRRVAVHRAIDEARRRPRREVVGLEIVNPASSPHQPDPWAARTLRRLVAALPPHTRAVLVLRYQQDLPPSEIAEVLHMPLNTVKSHLRRSLHVLRTRAARLLEASR